jgi:hypothetical protein
VRPETATATVFVMYACACKSWCLFHAVDPMLSMCCPFVCAAALLIIVVFGMLVPAEFEGIIKPCLHAQAVRKLEHESLLSLLPDEDCLDYIDKADVVSELHAPRVALFSPSARYLSVEHNHERVVVTVTAADNLRCMRCPSTASYTCQHVKRVHQWGQEQEELPAFLEGVTVAVGVTGSAAALPADRDEVSVTSISCGPIPYTPQHPLVTKRMVEGWPIHGEHA